MKYLTLNLVIPIAVISFALFTKWWYVLPIDAPDTILNGFPLPFICEGWHTSLSLQIFVLEFLVDFLVYFLFWFIAIYIINKYVITIRIDSHRRVYRDIRRALRGLTLLTILSFVFITAGSDNIFYFKRPWDMKTVKTGYKLIWDNQVK
ncbi:hypothetical protein HDF25_005232 [Pedobacter cryoconitis]|uniref:Uncharacterized protein n=1 Tax=Pedobacter cryoconitis TaxID=188932 RepID=A0A7X0MKY2_9SPHI|nr:hypothetical protein [Pedobacter cryoconitis]